MAKNINPDKAAPPLHEPADQPKLSELKEADKTSNPVTNDAESNDPPVRTDRPDVPIIGTLAVGAGAHEPPDSDYVDPDGRFNPGWDKG
jgi:hypothetical protein